MTVAGKVSIMYSLVVLAVLYLIQIQQTNGAVKFTNLKCTSFNKSFCEFTQCELKVLGRGQIGLNLYAKMKDFNMSNMTVNFALYKRANGYQPFLYNFTFDFCDFKKHPKRYPYFYLVHQAFLEYTNINHTCPYKHDMQISKWVLNDTMFTKFPLPTGIYKFKVRPGTDGIIRAELEAFIEVVEESWEKP